MRPKERQARIADVVRTKGRATVEALAQQFEASAETIRRDLGALAEQGEVHKVHGGAVAPRSRGEDSFRRRMGHNVAAKRHIARIARSLVDTGDTLFIDTGTTTLMFAEELHTIEDLTVITNSVEIAAAVTERSESARVYLVGGAYNADNRQTVGMTALEHVQRFRGTRAMITVGTIDAASGVMDYNIDEAQVARAMIENSRSAVILADSSKFDRIAPFSVGSLDRFDFLVCEREPGAALGGALEEARVEVLY